MPPVQPEGKADRALFALVSVLSVALSLFHLYTAYDGALLGILQRAVHLSGAFLIGFLMYSWKKNPSFAARLPDIALACIAAASTLYLLVSFEALVEREGEPIFLDTFWGVVTFLCVLELGRRTVGLALPVVCALATGYALFGKHLPAFVSHRGMDFTSFIYTMSSTEGVFGMPLGVSATYVFIFILFGSFLASSGASDAIIDLAKAVAGGQCGGPAKAAIGGSALMGSISGSAVANVVTTGTITIPLMIRLGYPPAFAAGVEAVASTGGVIMPPVMGAVAFLMAELLEKPYYEVAVAAAIPAVLYYGALYVMVDLRARRLGLAGIPANERPKARDVLRRDGVTLLPILVLIFLMVVTRTPTMMAAFLTICSSLPIIIYRHGIKAFPRILWDTLVDGAQSAVPIALGCALAGIVMGVINSTGLGIKLTTNLISLAGSSTVLMLMLTAAVSLVLGMGVSSAVAYLIPAMLMGPILIKAGIEPMAAHMFILYFAVLSFITPPVALASYAAAGIAKTNVVETGMMAFKLGLSGFIVPFAVAYGPSLVFIGEPWQVVTSICTAFMGAALLGCALEGWLWGAVPFWGRGVLFAAALCLVKPGLYTDAAGMGLAFFVGLYQYRRAKAAPVPVSG